VTGPFTEATTVDLLGRPISPEQVRDGLELALGPWEIRTVVFR
jgi:alpha-mannosidase